MTTRLFVSGDLSNGSELILEGERAHYLGRVLRRRAGERIFVFNRECGEWAADVVRVAKDTVVLRIGDPQATNTESALKVHLVQGVSRGERMDFVVQKATELGVKRITPVLTEHGVVRLEDERAQKRQAHWQGIAESACEQSGRTRPPLIDTPTALGSWLDHNQSIDSTELILRPTAPTPLTAIEVPTPKLCLLVGPEGGFSDHECGAAEAAGFVAASLGPRTLRTETAAVAAIAIAQHTWGDM